MFYFKGTHKLTFQMTTPEAQADAGYGGIKAFAFCENVIPELESLLNTIKVFLPPPHSIYGPHVPPYLEKAFVNFMRDAMGIEM